MAIGMRRFVGIGEALAVLRPGSQWVVRDNDFEKVEWHSTDIEMPSREEIEAKIVELEADEPKRCLREIRDWYLQNTDWTQNTDVRAIRGEEWCAAWDAYRQSLRDLPSNSPNVQIGPMNEILNVVWPVKPDLK